MRDSSVVQVVAGAEARGQLLTQPLPMSDQLVHARRLRRMLAGRVSVTDARIELGEVEETTLIGGG